MAITATETLSEMMSIQRKLLSHYIQLESLPQYPVELNEKNNQKLIKSFVARYVEELAEAYEQLLSALGFISQNREREARERIILYNEEMADANHFLLEILLYCNMDEYLIDEHLEEFFTSRGMENLYTPLQTIKNLLLAGNFINRNIAKSPGFNIYKAQERMEDPTIAGGSVINLELIEHHSSQLWNISYSLMIMVNELKNRPHRQTDTSVNMGNFFNKLILALVEIGRYWDFAGFTEQGLWQSYKRKSDTNFIRITNGY